MSAICRYSCGWQSLSGTCQDHVRLRRPESVFFFVLAAVLILVWSFGDTLSFTFYDDRISFVDRYEFVGPFRRSGFKGFFDMRPRIIHHVEKTHSSPKPPQPTQPPPAVLETPVGAWTGPSASVADVSVGAHGRRGPLVRHGKPAAEACCIPNRCGSE